MFDLLTVKVITVIAIALTYLLFDVFNKRNVPTVYAYSTIVIGLAFTATIGNLQASGESLLIAAVIASLGYVVYRVGQLGAADVIELTAISLIIPIQPQAYLTSQIQLTLPFIISVFIATGVAALILIPLYYLPRAERIFKKNVLHMITNRDIFKGILILCAYGIFIVFWIYEIGLSAAGIALVAVVMIAASVTVMFQKPITDSMVDYISPSRFEEGDIIALNLMSKSDISNATKKVKGFGKLVTISVLREIRRRKIAGKFPVYRQAMPFALPIFIGLVVSLLYGNIILLIL